MLGNIKSCKSKKKKLALFSFFFPVEKYAWQLKKFNLDQ